MRKRIFAENANLYWEKGIPCIPVPPGTKAGITKWPNYIDQLPNPKTRAEWIEKYSTHGIGVLTGIKIGDDRLVGIDVDDDDYVFFFERLIGTDGPIKKGKRGKTFFVRANGFDKKTSADGIVDILVRTVCVIPPTIHPDTQMPYAWEGKALHEYALDQLPYVSAEKLKIILAVLKEPEHKVLMGGDHTHDAALKLTAKLAYFDDDDLVYEVLKALFPKGYTKGGDKKNTLVELPELISSAKIKGFGQNQKAEYIYEAGEEGPIPYGYGEGGNYVFLHQKKKILVFATPSQLMSEPGLCDLAPMNFFKQWPRRNKDNHIIGIDAKGIGDMLMQACRDAGAFHASRVRGAGIWHENGAVVENLRGPLPLSKNYTYVRFGQLPEFEYEKGVDPAKVLDWLRLFPWTHSGHAELLLGWLATAAICGVFEWRPHVFISGPKHTGKTTLIDGITTLLEPLVINIDGSSTEAGIRQLIGPDSRPVVIDEFESDQNTHRMKSVIKLARSASSAKGTVARGTPEGKALQFQLSVTFLFAAINTVPGSNADQSRIVNLELKKHTNDKSVKALIDEGRAYFAERKTVWPHQMISLIEPIRAGVEVFVLAMPPGEFRHAMNMAVLLSGAFVALHDRTPTLEEAEQKVAEHAGLLGILAEAHDEDDSIDCLRHLLCFKPYGDNVLGASIYREVDGVIKQGIPVSGGTDPKDYGIILHKDGFSVANKHPMLSRIFDGTIWADGAWHTPLKRLPGALVGDEYRASFSGVSTRCVFVPFSALVGVDVSVIE